MPEFNIEKIHDTVWIFKRAIENPQDIIDYLENNTEWIDWYTFGKVTDIHGPVYNFNSFPTKEEWKEQFDANVDSRKDSKLLEIKKQIDNLFYDATSLYLKENNIDLDNWIFENWNTAKYIPLEDDPGYVMMHHTDFQRDLEYAPGNKFIVTAVFYLNDNYKGGEIEYRFVDGKDLQNIVADYSYKPSAGDVAVFLSGHPHYHGVKAVTEGEKYIIRTYWRHFQHAHPLWSDLKEKYGEEVWTQMQKDKHKYDEKTYGSINNIPFVSDFEEYYNKLENNEL
jgi:hypothetical protein